MAEALAVAAVKAEFGDPAELLTTVTDADSVASLVSFTTQLDEGTQWFQFFGGAMVFFMQAGFAMLTAGSVRAKNVKNVLIKNLMDASIGIIVYTCFGWGIAYGDNGDAGEFAGNANFFLQNSESFKFGTNGDGTAYNEFFFQWAFSAAAATIVCGGVAERCNFKGYIVYASVLTGFIYPVVAHWVWSGNAWLTTEGFTDFAGSGVVHMVGGVAALCGSIVLGPRVGRFNPDGTANTIKGHNAALSVLGTFILWFGWFGFNPVSALSFDGVYQAELVAVNTTLAAGAGAVTSLAFTFFTTGVLDLGISLNGLLGGLVAITGPCAFVAPYASIIIGSMAGVIYCLSSKAIVKLKIDDPLDAFSVHGACGAFGLIVLGLFAESYIGGQEGLFHGDGELLGWQIAGLLTILAWTAGTTYPLFYAIDKTIGLRVSAEAEELGADLSKHGGAAYPEE